MYQTVPLLKGRTLFSRISLASVPSSMRSNFVITPIVRTPGIKNQEGHPPAAHNQYMITVIFTVSRFTIDPLLFVKNNQDIINKSFKSVKINLPLKSDQNRISPYNINTISSRQVMSTKKIIN